MAKQTKGHLFSVDKDVGLMSKNVVWNEDIVETDDQKEAAAEQRLHLLLGSNQAGEPAGWLQPIHP